MNTELYIDTHTKTILRNIRDVVFEATPPSYTADIANGTDMGKTFHGNLTQLSAYPQEINMGRIPEEVETTISTTPPTKANYFNHQIEIINTTKAGTFTGKFLTGPQTGQTVEGYTKTLKRIQD